MQKTITVLKWIAGILVVFLLFPTFRALYDWWGWIIPVLGLLLLCSMLALYFTAQGGSQQTTLIILIIMVVAEVLLVAIALFTPYWPGITPDSDSAGWEPDPGQADTNTNVTRVVIDEDDEDQDQD